MYDYFNDNNLLIEQQYRFRNLLFTEFASLKLTDGTSQQREPCKTPCNLYIDFSKDFDTLSFDILLHKLKYYCFSGTELKLLKCYLTNREQYVKYNHYQSELIDIFTGAPQGPILEPLLFSIYINDIMNADESTIYLILKIFIQLVLKLK